MADGSAKTKSQYQQILRRIIKIKQHNETTKETERAKGRYYSYARKSKENITIKKYKWVDK